MSTTKTAVGTTPEQFAMLRKMSRAELVVTAKRNGLNVPTNLLRDIIILHIMDARRGAWKAIPTAYLAN